MLSLKCNFLLYNEIACYDYTKKKQRVEKRKKNFLFSSKKNINFELKDFADIRNISKRRKKVFKLKNFFKKIDFFLKKFLYFPISLKYKILIIMNINIIIITLKKKFLTFLA